MTEVMLVLLRLALVSTFVGLIIFSAGPKATCQPVTSRTPATESSSVSPNGSAPGAESGSPQQAQPSGESQTGSTSSSVPVSPPTSATAKPPAGPSVESVLSELESRYFVHPYSQDPVEQRLARLEQFVFGKRSSGNPAPRLARLKNVLRPLQATAPTAKSASPQPTGSPSIQPGGAAPNVGSGAAAKTSAT
ncbi:MAG TPA: hypothetical protein V6C69_18815, partial [Trichormus sp.]